MPSASRSSVAQFSVSASQLINLFRIYEKRRLNLAGKRPSRRHIRSSKLAKGLQSVKVFLLQYRKNRKVGSIWRARGDALRFFIPSVASHQKSLTMPEKREGGTF